MSSTADGSDACVHSTMRARTNSDHTCCDTLLRIDVAAAGTGATLDTVVVLTAAGVALADSDAAAAAETREVRVDVLTLATGGFQSPSSSVVRNRFLFCFDALVRFPRNKRVTLLAAALAAARVGRERLFVVDGDDVTASAVDAVFVSTSLLSDTVLLLSLLSLLSSLSVVLACAPTRSLRNDNGGNESTMRLNDNALLVDAVASCAVVAVMIGGVECTVMPE
jgi:hypothetical protein